ncbi:MAG TPA: ATP synthase F1 subunit delta, partial [Ruminococcaceae bacterium]|nr:ATP synthase F1 subunit delta [Oscillospiraceae bacterium]
MAQISNEYAEALFALAMENESVKEYSEALDIVLKVMIENPEYIDFLASPDIPKQERVGAIESAFGGSIPETVVSFLCLLCDRGRIHTLKDC